MNQTVKTGHGKGRLIELAKDASRIALDRRLLEDLLEKKVGKMKMETEALKLTEDAAKYEGKKGKRKKIQGEKITCKIREQRDEEKVKDLVRLKLKYCCQEERKIQKEYKREKTRTEREMKEAGKAEAYRRLIRGIAKTTTKRWNKGLKRVNRKVQWSVTKRVLAMVS